MKNFDAVSVAEVYTYAGNDPTNHADPTGEDQASDDGHCGSRVGVDPSCTSTTLTIASSDKKKKAEHPENPQSPTELRYPDAIQSTLGPESAPLAGGIIGRILAALGELLGIASSHENISNLPKTRAELDADLRRRGFVNRGTSPGGYTTYKNPDGTGSDNQTDGGGHTYESCSLK